MLRRSQRQEYGVRWQEIDRKDRVVTKEKVFATEDERRRFCSQLEVKDNFVRWMGWLDPTSDGFFASLLKGDVMDKRASKDDKEWDKWEFLKEVMGVEALLDEIIVGLSHDEAEEMIEWIARMHDIRDPVLGDEEEEPEDLLEDEDEDTEDEIIDRVDRQKTED